MNLWSLLFSRFLFWFYFLDHRRGFLNCPSFNWCNISNGRYICRLVTYLLYTLYSKISSIKSLLRYYFSYLNMSHYYLICQTRWSQASFTNSYIIQIKCEFLFFLYYSLSSWWKVLVPSRQIISNLQFLGVYIVISISALCFAIWNVLKWELIPSDFSHSSLLGR